ncbi:MAG: DUF2490 domain-containing protein [Pyrinomonadaceae bacterium]
MEGKRLRIRPLARSILTIHLLLLLSGFIFGQLNAAPDDEDVQQWNDFQVTASLTKEVDSFFTATTRFGKNISRVTEGRIGLGFVYKLNKAFSVSPSYVYIRARNTAGRYRTENRLSLNAVYRFPVKNFGLSHRSQYEYRIRSTGDSWRYRPSLTFEKDLPGRWIPKSKFFITEEPFYISTTRKFSRNRISVGVKKTVNKNVSVDVYYMRQNDGFSHPGDLNVIGTSWKLKF